MPYSLLAYLFGILLLLSSCNTIFDEESLDQEIPVPVQLSISESYLSTRAPVTTIDGTNLSNVGIYGVQEGSTSGQFPWTAVPFASNLSPSSISQGQFSFSPKLYYPIGGKRVIFYAYYPRTNNTTSTLNSYITPSGNGTAPVYNFTLSDQQDVMQAVSTISSSQSGTNVTLQYNHKLCQLVINTNLLSGTLRGMKLIAVPTKGSMNIETGAITWNTTTADISLNVPLLGGPSDPVFIPANVSSYKLQVTLLLFTTTYILTPNNGTFSPGVVYTITLK